MFRLDVKHLECHAAPVSLFNFVPMLLFDGTGRVTWHLHSPNSHSKFQCRCCTPSASSCASCDIWGPYASSLVILT